MAERKTRREQADVVVVGAGLSGLVAARALKRAGRRVQVVEARERVGGRLLSERIAGGPTVDLGGQWIGPGQDRVLALVDELRIERLRQYNEGKHCICIGGKARYFTGDIPSMAPLGLAALQWAILRLDWLGRSIDLEAPYQSPQAARWDAMTVETWKQKAVPHPEARAGIDMAVRAVFAAEPAEVSMLHFLFYLKSGNGLMRLITIDGGAQQERLVGGAQSICEKLALELDEELTFSSPVQAIEIDDEAVSVVHKTGTTRAKRVIVAMAPSMWRKIDWRPGLDGARLQLSQRMPMGAVIKFFSCYERPFWREKGFSGEFLNDGAGLQMGFDYVCGDSGQAALVGFMTGQYARAWSGRSKEERQAAALSTMARFFGEEALSPQYFFEKDWVCDPWSQGCYAGLMTPGTWTDSGHLMREPSGPLHWAGTETAVRGNGYMDGAIEAGLRCAEEVGQALS